jgi:hypothetical protein
MRSKNLDITNTPKPQLQALDYSAQHNALTPVPCIQTNCTQQASVQSKVCHALLVKHMLQPCTMLLFGEKGYYPSQQHILEASVKTREHMLLHKATDHCVEEKKHV